MALDWPYTTETTMHSRKTHWVGSLSVQERGADQEPGKRTIEWELQKAGKSWKETKGENCDD
jgi:hypothetical protein